MAKQMPTGTPMMDWFQKTAVEAADNAFNALMQTGGGTSLYLWHKRGGLVFAADKPGAEWELTDPRIHRGSMTRDQMRAWTLQAARRSPCLPVR